MESQTKTQNKNQLSLFALKNFDRSLLLFTSSRDGPWQGHSGGNRGGRCLQPQIVGNPPKMQKGKIFEYFVPVLQIFYTNDNFREENIFVLKMQKHLNDHR